MMPRGEVTLIFASAGLAAGVLDRTGYGALLIVVICTAIGPPVLLRHRLERRS
jgi:Kef-type K+ transport system membrane component KefB